MNDFNHHSLDVALTLLIGTDKDECEELHFSLATLKEFPQYDLDDVALTCLSGADKGRIKHYRGARLRDVISHIGIEAADKRMLKNMLIIARAHDGYTALFSWNELFNTLVGDRVLVLYERNGEPLDEGNIGLISADDIRNGQRHIKGLREIELRPFISQ